jgi:hypothetical protein
MTLTDDQINDEMDAYELHRLDLEIEADETAHLNSLGPIDGPVAEEA